MGERQKARQWQMAERRTEVAKLLLKGWSERRIAAHLDVSPSTICEDSKAIASEWAEQRVSATDKIRAMDLEKLALVESAALSIMENPVVSTKDGEISDPDVALRAGGAVIKSLERRSKMLGLDAAIEVKVQQEMSREVDALLSALKGKLSADAFDEVVTALGGGGEEITNGSDGESEG